MSAILNHFEFFQRLTSFFWRLQRQVTERITETLKLMMLTSCQWPGVLTFFSKEGTQVCFCALDRSYVAFNILVRGPLTFGNQIQMNPPTLRKLLSLNPPSASEFSMIFPGGAVWKFSGTTPCMACMALRLALCPASSILFCLGNKIVFADHRGFLSRAGVPFILQSEEETLSLL